MAIFAVIGLGDATALGNAILEQFPDNYYTLDSSKWLVAADGLTAKDVVNRVGLTKETGSQGIVIAISVGGYNGFAPADIWEWIKAKAVKTNA